ncbi:MAG: hypothetical protein PHR71_06805 [Polaromonas sp.]|nr:hypothetical protein [Polaromonas sp.]
MRDAQLPIAGIRVAIRKSPTSQYIYQHLVTTIMPLNGLQGQPSLLKSSDKVLQSANKKANRCQSGYGGAAWIATLRSQ